MRVLLPVALRFAQLAAAVRGGPISGHAAATGIQEAHPFYHTSDQLESALRGLDGKCQGARFRLEYEGDAAVPVMDLPSTGDERVRVMLVFGEHAREFISAESALALADSLCGPSAEAVAARREASYLLVANANPLGRRHAEAGAFCARANENGVDLNRNYGAHWQQQAQGGVAKGIALKDGRTFKQYDSGSEAFSEPETRVVRRLVEAFKPSAYVSVHSGTEALLAPWAWTQEMPKESGAVKRMGAVMTAIGEKYCGACRIGEAAEEVGYLAGGVSSDYAFSAGTPFAFTWEIFAGEGARASDDIDKTVYDAKKEVASHKTTDGGFDDSSLGDDTDSSVEALLKSADLEASHRKQAGLIALRGRVKRSSLAADEYTDGDDNPSDCFAKFNPISKEDYSATLTRWTSAFLDLPGLVRQQG